MVSESSDGRELARRLADALAAAAPDGPSVVDEPAGPDGHPDAGSPEPTPDGTVAYAVADGSQTLADVFVHPDRLRIEFRAAPEEAARAARAASLRVRPKAVRPPRTLVFVEAADEIEPALDVLGAVRTGVE